MHAAIGNFANNVATLGHLLLARHQVLAAAESCTGGMLASRLVDHPGASEWFYGSFVTYQACAKSEMLGIDKFILREHGLVSEQTVMAMSRGVLEFTSADYAIALSGVAGPADDGSASKVGELWIAWGEKADDLCTAEWFELTLPRSEYRMTACALAVEGFLKRFA